MNPSIPRSSSQCCSLNIPAIHSRFQAFQALYRSTERAAQEAFRSLLQEQLDSHVTEQLGRGRYAPAQAGDRTTLSWKCNECGNQVRAFFVRNGHYQRGVATGWGYVAAIRIPMLRCKRCGQGYVPLSFPFLAKYVRFWDDLARQAILACTLGLSLRRQQEQAAACHHEVASLRTLNQRINVVVQKLPLLAGQPLSDIPPVVQFDGIYFTLLKRTLQSKPDARGRLRRELRTGKRVALVALGLWPDGRHEVLGWTLASEEGTEDWKSFLLTLHQRGLTLANGFRLAVGDGAGGLREALQFVYYQQLPFERCHFHKIKRIVHRDYLHDSSHRNDLLREAGKVLAQKTEAEVRVQLKTFCQKWQALEPDSVRCFLRDFEDCLTHFRLNLDGVQYARTTSHAERVMRELRRKLRQVGTLITEVGVEATLTLLFRRMNAQWSQKPWLDETLEAIWADGGKS